MPSSRQTTYLDSQHTTKNLNTYFSHTNADFSQIFSRGLDSFRFWYWINVLSHLSSLFIDISYSFSFMYKTCSLINILAFFSGLISLQACISRMHVYCFHSPMRHFISLTSCKTSFMSISSFWYAVFELRLLLLDCRSTMYSWFGFGQDVW